MHIEKPIALGILISGGGSTMEAIGVSSQSGMLEGKEVHRVSNLIYPPEAPFLQQAVIYAREAYPHG